MWRLDEVADAAAAGLLAREAALREEQAVKGLDALDEVGLHTVLAAGFAAAGFGVLREQRFPSALSNAAPSPSAPAEGVAESGGGARPGEVRGFEDGWPAIPKDSDRERCDLVLTPEPGQRIADPIRGRRAERGRKKAAAGTLFEALALAETPVPQDRGGAVQPGDAMWLEVKVVGQIAFEHGVPMANRDGSQLVRGVVGDLTKLGRDPLLLHSAAVMVLFSADRQTAEHDLLVVAHKCVDKGLTAAAPIVRYVPIADRVGNTIAAAAVFRTCR